MEIRFKKLHSDAKLPTKAKPGDAGFDVYAVEDFVLQRDVVTLVKTGLQIAYITPGFEVQVRSRSGNASRGVTITNSPGTIDNGYRGEVAVLMTAQTHTVFKRGDRIAQLIPQRIEEAFCSWGEIENTERGACGFGSTGR